MVEKRSKAVRVPLELEKMDLPGVIRACEEHLARLRDAQELRKGGDEDAAQAVEALATRKLGQVVGQLVAETLNGKEAEGNG